MAGEVSLEAVGVEKTFGSRRGGGHKAVAGIDLFLDSSVRLGIVGESGSGKSTLARMLVGLERPSAGTVQFRGLDVATLAGADRTEFRRSVQLIAQDTSSSFDPRRTLREAVRRPAQVLLGDDEAAANDRVDATLELVGLPVGMADRKPHEVSGGQRQRFAICRALIVSPRILVCDEVVSALDVSVQGTVLNFLRSYCASHDAGLVFVSHGLPATAFIADDLIVMRYGEVVESGPTVSVLFNSCHPYTASLVAAYRGDVPREAGSAPTDPAATVEASVPAAPETAVAP